MSLSADTIVDRRRLRRKLTFWRVLAVLLQALFGSPLALMVTGNTPRAVGVPEISPGVQPSELLWQTVKPPGRSVASNVIGLLLAVIW